MDDVQAPKNNQAQGAAEIGNDWGPTIIVSNFKGSPLCGREFVDRPAAFEVPLPSRVGQIPGRKFERMEQTVLRPNLLSARYLILAHRNLTPHRMARRTTA